MDAPNLLKKLIEDQVHQFFDWDGCEDQHIVTTTSAKLFAEHVAILYLKLILDEKKAIIQTHRSTNNQDNQNV